jgi:hypothetical protein
MTQIYPDQNQCELPKAMSSPMEYQCEFTGFGLVLMKSTDTPK